MHWKTQTCRKNAYLARKITPKTEKFRPISFHEINVFVHSCVNQLWMLFFWTNTSPVSNYLLDYDLHRVTMTIKLSEAVETITPKYEQDRTVFENDWTNIWSLINFRLFLVSPKKSHAWFMMSSLSRTKGFTAVNIRLFTDSSVKREWSFFLFWALNPRSQGTMPTGMIRPDV